MGLIIAAGVVFGVATACVVYDLKKKCIPFVKKLVKIDEDSKRHRRVVETARLLFKKGEITRHEFDEIKNRWSFEERSIRAFTEETDKLQKFVENFRRFKELSDMRDQKAQELLDFEHYTKLQAEGKQDEALQYQTSILRKATEELIAEGKMTVEEKEILKSADMIRKKG